MEDMKKTIGSNIRIIRKSKGMTLKTLSDQIGMSHQQLSRIENGMGTSTATLERIATILDVDMNVLFNEPKTTLQDLIPRTKNYVPKQLCEQMYGRLYEYIIKPTNDSVINVFMGEVFRELIEDRKRIHDLIVEHLGDEENYQFTQAELLEFSRMLFVDFLEYAMKLSKEDDEEQEESYEEW